MLSKVVFKNVLYNSSSMLILNLSGLIIVVFLARVLKPELFGLYSLSISIITVAMVFADLGINNAATRYVADAVSKNNFRLASGYVSFLTNFKVALSVFLSILLFLLSDTISSAFNKPISLLIKLLSIYLVFNALTTLFLAIANAMNDFKVNLLNYTVSGFSKIVFTFSLVLVGLSVIGAIFAIVLSAILGFFYALYYTTKKYPFLFSEKEKIEFNRVLKFVAFTAVISISWVLFANVDLVMIGYFLTAEDVAYYRAGFSIISAIAGFISIPSVLLPVFVKLEGEDLSRAFSRAFKFSSALCIPSALGLILISSNLLFLAYGEEYLPGLLAMQILSLLLISPVFGIYGSFFSGKEKPELNFYPLTFSTLLNVVLNYFMIPRFGIVGASMATVISNVILWLFLALICSKEFGIKPKISYITKPLFSALLMFLVAFNFGSMILILPISILVYSAVLFLIKGITKEDLEFIKKIGSS
ncbi:MAG: flippase [Archaeoglobaceae archaeon]